MDIKDKIQGEYACRYKTEYYDFYCKPSSFALGHIAEIAAGQERCYKKITVELNVYPNFRLEYWLADSPRELGVLYGDNQPCNGFVSGKKIFAVYNDKIKCTGMHEDAHAISFSVKKPASAFICEGLAMYFDGQWQGKTNEDICRQMLAAGSLPSALPLIANDKFWALSEEVSYPLAGAFTRFLVQKLTMSAYLKDIYYNDDAENCLKALSDGKVLKEFTDWLKLN